MRNFLIITFIISALIGGRQQATAASAEAAPVFDWSGFYIGANAGASLGRSDTHYTLAPVSDSKLNSFIVGGHLGYNQQLGFAVLGVESDIAWRHGEADNSVHFPNGTDISRFHGEQNWIGTLRPRVGIALSNVLFYGTAGLAFGNLEHKYSETRTGVASRSKSESETDTGWTVGGGINYGFNRNWSAGLEYLFVDFGSTRLGMPAQLINGVSFPANSTKFNDRSHVIRAKLSYAF